MCGSSCPDSPPQIRSASEGPRPKSGPPYVDETGGRAGAGGACRSSRSGLGPRTPAHNRKGQDHLVPHLL
eukprot:360430-Chlamydomonas_euryale.AAC.3